MTRKNIIIVGDLGETRKTIRAKQAKIAQGSREEIDRIVKDFGA